MLPGTDLTKTAPRLMSEVEQRMNPQGLHPYHAMCLSKRVDKSFLSSPFFQALEFYLYYTRHDCPKKNRIHLADRSSTVTFLNERIHPERGQGLDVVVTTEDMVCFLICSHDGDMFFRKPSEWSADAIHLGQSGKEASEESESE